MLRQGQGKVTRGWESQANVSKSYRHRRHRLFTTTQAAGQSDTVRHPGTCQHIRTTQKQAQEQT